MRTYRFFRRSANGRARPLLLLWALLVPAGVSLGQGLLDESLQTQRQTDQAAAESQLRISQLADETADMLGEYRVALQRLEQVRTYNEHLERLLGDQQREERDIRRQLDEFSDVQLGVVPLMLRMIEDLARFVELDLPFQPEERRERLDRLRDTMDRADVTDSEKFRQIIEAYQIETAFGRDIEAYRAALPGTEQRVDFLRVGRVLLAYQTPDRSETGFWNVNSGEWEVLPDRYRAAITQGLRIARSQAAPELLVLPVATPAEAGR